MTVRSLRSAIKRLDHMSAGLRSLADRAAEERQRAEVLAIMANPEAMAVMDVIAHRIAEIDRRRGPHGPAGPVACADPEYPAVTPELARAFERAMAGEEVGDLDTATE
jgi:hypothetical protein